jgi:hypothetical protein
MILVVHASKPVLRRWRNRHRPAAGIFSTTQPTPRQTEGGGGRIRHAACACEEGARRATAVEEETEAGAGLVGADGVCCAAAPVPGARQPEEFPGQRVAKRASINEIQPMRFEFAIA